MARMKMSGNVGRFVGFNVGFWDQPDMERLKEINSLGQECRECRVSTTGERFGESGKNSESRPRSPNPLIRLDLHDAGS
jgi:hypothetical protein